eukprot:811943-Amphidinium_carterae.1
MARTRRPSTYRDEGGGAAQEGGFSHAAGCQAGCAVWHPAVRRGKRVGCNVQTRSKDSEKHAPSDQSLSQLPFYKAFQRPPKDHTVFTCFAKSSSSKSGPNEGDSSWKIRTSQLKPHGRGRVFKEEDMMPVMNSLWDAKAWTHIIAMIGMNHSRQAKSFSLQSPNCTAS